MWKNLLQATFPCRLPCQQQLSLVWFLAPCSILEELLFFFFLRCFSLIDHFFLWGIRGAVFCLTGLLFHLLLGWSLWKRFIWNGLAVIFFFSHLRQECRWAVLLILLLPPGRNLSFHSWSKEGKKNPHLKLSDASVCQPIQQLHHSNSNNLHD